jgi:hypothetical protein
VPPFAGSVSVESGLVRVTPFFFHVVAVIPPPPVQPAVSVTVPPVDGRLGVGVAETVHPEGAPGVAETGSHLNVVPLT